MSAPAMIGIISLTVKLLIPALVLVGGLVKKGVMEADPDARLLLVVLAEDLSLPSGASTTEKAVLKAPTSRMPSLVVTVVRTLTVKS